MIRRIAPLALWGLTACGAASSDPSVAAAPSGSSSSTASSSAPSPVAAPAVCEEVIDRYRQTLRAATGRCTSDAECVRYGGVDPDDLCGGVTDAKTGRSLKRISEELDAARCPRAGYSCPAMVPTCDAGACR